LFCQENSIYLQIALKEIDNYDNIFFANENWQLFLNPNSKSGKKEKKKILYFERGNGIGCLQGL